MRPADCGSKDSYKRILLMNSEEKKTRNKSFILGILIFVLAFGTVFSVWHISKARMNAEPKKAFEAVLQEYKQANEMGFFEYYSSKENFKYVSPRAMMLVSDGSSYGFRPRNLYYDYYDLNYDGIDELLIGFRLEGEEGKYFSTEDIFVYIKGEVKSVYEGSWLRENAMYLGLLPGDDCKNFTEDEQYQFFPGNDYIRYIYDKGYTDPQKITFVPVTLEKNNYIKVETREFGEINCEKKSWYKLDEKGEKLVLDRELKCYFYGKIPMENTIKRCYENGKEISIKEYGNKHNDLKDVYDPGNSGGPMHYKPIFQ